MSAFKDAISAINAAGEIRRLGDAAAKFWDFQKKLKMATAESNMHQATIKTLVKAIQEHERKNKESAYPRNFDFDKELYDLAAKYKDDLKSL